MSKPRRGIVGKPSKASLKSRGLSASTSSTLRPESSEACYSLYSTDTEDNVSGVNHGLDKCAELLTNILEIKYEEKGMKKSAYGPGKLQRQQATAITKTKRAKSAPHSKSALTKIKPKATINIPTGEARRNVQKSKTAYNEQVVASTPVLTAEQRRHLQELQKKESSLKQQIQLLQQEYDNLESTDSVAESKQNPHSSNTKLALITDDNSNDPQETKSSRRSLDFSNNAEKPFADIAQTQRKNPTTKGAESVSAEHGKARKVQFEAKTPGSAETNISENTLVVENQADQNHRSPQDQHVKKTELSSKPAVQTEALRRGVESPQRYIDHLRILAYLVGELRAILASTDDNEVNRLLTEIESEIRLLTSYTVHSPRLSPEVKEPRRISSPRKKSNKKQHDIDTEIALQPLRSENSDLRRKLRIANQKTRDLEEKLQKAGENKKEYTNEGGVMEHLHQQLFLERENVRQLKQQNEQAEKIIAQRSQENSELQDLVSEKDEDLENLQDELRRLGSKSMKDVDSHSRQQVESMEMTVRAKNKEVEFLKLAIEQRDAEIERLTELTRGLQQSLTRVLTNVRDLHPHDVLSDVSMFSEVNSAWKPTTTEPQNAMPSMRSKTARVYPEHQVHQSVVHSDEELDVRTLQSGNREFTKVTSHGIKYRRTSIDSVNEDDTTTSVSSGDEFVFKQELANLDTMIARLQDNLRSK